MNAIEALAYTIQTDVASILSRYRPPPPVIRPLDGAGQLLPPSPPPMPQRRTDDTFAPSRPSGMPVHGHVSSVFGVQRRTHRHNGEDIAAPRGTPVLATAAGHCIGAEAHAGYGNMVTLDHGGGYVTRYAHLGLMLCAPGEQIDRGQVVGLVGTTGHSTGPHLHYEVLVHNHFTDPKAYL